MPSRVTLLALCLFVACSDRAALPPSAADRAAHARMATRLAEIALDQDNPYFGKRALESTAAALDAITTHAPLRRWRANYLLGWLLTREGRDQEAVDHLTVAQKLATGLKAYLLSNQEHNVRFDQVTALVPGKETEFELGLACLRLGETSNCVARHTSQSCILPITGGGVHVDQEPARQAIRWFLDVLEAHPRDVTTRWLLNIAAMAVGEYPDGIPRQFALPEASLQSQVEFPRFADIAPRLHLNNGDQAGGSVIDDFDGDGDLDVITSSIHTRESLHYLRNDIGSFSDRTATAGFADIPGGLNLIHGDYDNDGDLDLFVTRGAWWGPQGRHPNSLLRNHGDGTFIDVTYSAGLADPAWPTQTAAFADYDNDGDLDLYVGNESMRTMPAPSQLFRNNDDGTFADVAVAAGVTNMRFAKGVTWADYDNDRFPDLYVSNLWGDNRLYHNNRDGTFTDVAVDLGVTRPIAGFATWFFDYDNDGTLDLYVGSFLNEPRHVVAPFFGESTGAELSCLYHGGAHGSFTEVAPSMGLTQPTMPMGANFGDLDNDGYPDFYLGTGYPNYEGVVPNFMYWNRGGTHFADVTFAGGFGHLQKGHAVTFADFDDDGDQDVFEQMGGVFPGDGFGDVLFENPGFRNHWVKVRLIGVQSNRFGIGARIRADIVEDGRPRSVYRWLNAGGSFGENPLRADIGLGRAERIDVLEVYWPTSATTQTFRDLAVDCAIEITEFDGSPRSLPLSAPGEQ